MAEDIDLTGRELNSAYAAEVDSSLHNDSALEDKEHG